MPRDIPVGNGQMLVNFDPHYRVRDLYFPHVGQENHAGGTPCRFGVWAPLPPESIHDGERRRQRLYWSDDGWDIRFGYRPQTLATDVHLHHPTLRLDLHCCDVVDFHRPVLVRRIEVTNHSDHPRQVSLFHHHDFQMYGVKMGDTAYFDPQLRCLVHYRQSRYITAAFYLDGEQQIDEYATGTAGFGGAEGTFRDAEDGRLGGNGIAQGAVDSTMMACLELPARGSRVIYLVLGCGRSHDDIVQIHRFLHREGPQGAIDRTIAYWRLWLAATRSDLDDAGSDHGLPDEVVELFKRSLLLVRSQIDNSGAIIAANDSDVMQFSRDTYSYLWPRDGAMVADAMDSAGFPDVSRSFFSLCAKLLTEGGYFLHKYNPDGSPASSWHPWVAAGRPQLPIQEDETALVLWALWRHYLRYRDIEFVRPLWIRLVRPAGDFLARYRDPETGLPLPSYDLWEERWGIHAFTLASTWAGLRAAWQFAVCFGDVRRASRYARAAGEVQAAFLKYLWSEEHGRFLRRIVPRDQDRVAALTAEVLAGRDPIRQSDAFDIALPGNPATNGHTRAKKKKKAAFELDSAVDSSLYGIFAFGLLPVDDERVASTMEAVAERLWVRTDVGGIARYENDHYHRMVGDTERVPGNPWFICTLWLAEYYIARAKSEAELDEALPLLQWVVEHALPSGVLAEQVHPETNAPLSVSPLTWSHATVVSTVMAWLSRRDEMRSCPRCGQAGAGALPDARLLRRDSLNRPSPLESRA